MHILFLTDNFPPEVNAPASRTYEHCRVWAREGHQITIITSNPNFPRGKIYDGYKNKLWQREAVDGMRVIRVWTWVNANEGVLKRILDQLSYMVTSFFSGLFIRKVDLIVGTSPQFFTVCSAHALAVLKRKPWIFELRDVWPESIKAVGAMKDSWMLGLLGRVEVYLYRRASLIVSVTNSFVNILKSRGIDTSKVVVVTNGVQTSHFRPMQKNTHLLDKLALTNKFVVGYIGTHGMAHALDTVLDAAAIVDASEVSEEIHFILLGHGAEKARLQMRAEKEGIKSLTFIDSVSKQEVLDYYSVLDASLVHLKKSKLFKSVIPSKIFEAMAMGLPIIIGTEGESADIVLNEKVGIKIEQENADALFDAALRLHNDKTLMKKLSKSGIIAAYKYDRENLALCMLKHLEELHSQHANKR